MNSQDIVLSEDEHIELSRRGRKPSLPAEALKRVIEQVTQPRIRAISR
jgi:hypothetical protein